MAGFHLDEMNVESVDLGDELRESVQLLLCSAPVVFGPPVAHDLLEACQLYALRAVIDRFRIGQTRRRNAAAELIDLCLRDVDHKGADWVAPGGGQRLWEQAERSGGRRGGK